MIELRDIPPEEKANIVYLLVKRGFSRYLSENDIRESINTLKNIEAISAKKKAIELIKLIDKNEAKKYCDELIKLVEDREELNNLADIYWEFRDLDEKYIDEFIKLLKKLKRI
jgi:transcriptional accessory protein Tex/SPT6